MARKRSAIFGRMSSCTGPLPLKGTDLGAEQDVADLAECRADLVHVVVIQRAGCAQRGHAIQR